MYRSHEIVTNGQHTVDRSRAKLGPLADRRDRLSRTIGSTILSPGRNRWKTMPTGVTQSRGFDGVRVIALESRRSVEMARLIESYGGVPRVAPSMREVPIERNQHALRFAAAPLGGQFDMMIVLAGMGTRALTKVVETRHRREEFVEALTKVTIVARGPKPIAVLKELHVPVDVKVPEPNTWLELLQAIDPVRAGLRVAVQEYWHAEPGIDPGTSGSERYSHPSPGLPVGVARGHRTAAAGHPRDSRKAGRCCPVHDIGSGAAPNL